MRAKAFIGLLIISSLFLVIPVLKTYSFDCSQESISGSHTQDEWNQIKEACQRQYNASNNQIYDAKAQLRSINSKYDLSVAQMRQTEQKIEDTQKEIEVLNTRIDGLDTSLDYLSKLLVQRIINSYKNNSVSIFNLIFDSNNAADLIEKIKYMKIAQNNNQRILIQVQEAKLNFEEQKKIRDAKKDELDSLKLSLAKQQSDLQYQKQKKDQDIALLSNNLAETQRILDIAQQQIAGFKSFVTSAGVGVISSNQFGNGSDGNYYSQRDGRWASRTIGYSSESILNVGCLVSSVAMAAKKFGSGLTPADVAADVGRFFGNTAYMKLPWPGVGGRSYSGLSQSEADQELENGNYVIAGIRQTSCSGGGDHFVVLTKKSGGEYIMHDPIYGPDKKFNDHYSSFCSFAAFK